MIRGQKASVTAVRRPGGGVAIDVQPLPAVSTGWMRRIPLLRGVVVLIEAMVLGIRSLIYSANVSLEEEEEQLTQKSVWAMLAAALILAVGLFFVAPLFLTKLASPLATNTVVFHIVEGVIRLAFFLAYLWLISLLPDIKRVFTYHGAEHKSFIFIVLIIAIVVFAAIGRQELWIMVITRILLIPVIAGLSYEVTYFGAKYGHHKSVRAILSPGLWLQSLTTGEPDDNQLEIGIAALNKALEIDRAEEAAQTAS